MGLAKRQEPMTGILLDAIYAAGLVLASPVWVYRMIRHGRYRSGWGERFGRAPVRYGLQPLIWIHGVSMGEVNAARSLVQELHSQLPDYRVAISSTTDTGLAAARRLFAPDHAVFHWPLDFTWSVRRALGRLRPALVVLMEGEVWPNFLAACNRRGIPAVVVNGRLSPRGLRWRKLGPLARRVFNRLAAVGVQEESYARMFEDLGLEKSKVHVTGMLKYDTAEITDRIAGQDELGRAMGLAAEDRLIVAGGTGPGEERMLLDIYPALKARHPRARLAVVPRKPERFEEVARLIVSAGLPLVRRSQRPDGTGDIASMQPIAGGPATARPVAVPGTPATRDAVLLGDTMGELRKFYALASCVFVGRSLVPMGGSDMIESAALGKPTAFGPHTFNFPQAGELARHGCTRVADAAALREQLDRWLSDEAAAGAAGAAARDYVRSQQGATRRNVEMICRLLGRVPAVRPGDIATPAIVD
jgi:3-deoxy-D-manno-octulosonic-acid transferase